MPIRTPLALFFAAVALVMATTAHAARLATPKPLMPAAGAATEAIPVFGWGPVANADHYEFQVAADSGFNSPVIGSSEDHFVTRNTRATLSQTQDFGMVAEDIHTDNTAYAPPMTQMQYLNGGTLYWRVAAVDADRNEGDFSPAQKIGFASKMRVQLMAFPLAGRWSKVTVKLMDFTNKPVGRAAVRVTGKGLKVPAKRTSKAGSVTFRIRPKKGVAILFRAIKTGYVPATTTYKVR